MLVFRTKDDHPHDVQIVGAGVAGAFGKGGVPVEKAALTMPELQEKDEFGWPKLDDQGQPVPLSGAKLDAAAKDWAESRGLVATKASEEKIRGLAAERGALPDFDADDALAAAGAYYEQYSGSTEPIKTTTEEMVHGSKRQAALQAQIEAQQNKIREAVEAAPDDQKVAVATAETEKQTEKEVTG